MLPLFCRRAVTLRILLLTLIPGFTLLAQAVPARPGFAQKPESAPEGTIAYVRGGKTPGDEIRLIRPDGTGDRQIWHIPVAISSGVGGLSWRPDGKEIAFSSDHDAANSVYESNIYALHPDGTGLRRLTDPPGAAGLAKYPKGRVIVTVANPLTDASLFLVYVSGAPAPVTAVIAAGHRPWSSAPRPICRKCCVASGCVRFPLRQVRSHGRWIVFERRAGEAPPDLWIMRIDGSDMRLLVKRGAAPVWSR